MTATLTPGAAAEVVRPTLTYRDHLLGVLAGLWMVVGLFLDGWAHDELKPESFFTPWHAVLYSGFGAAATYALYVVWRNRIPNRPLVDAVPHGHGLTLVALVVFAIGGAGDLVWHEVLGIEVGVEALLSPTHLLLLVGGLAALSAPLRLAWATEAGDPEGLRAFLPPLLSLTLSTAVVGFFLLYLSPFLNDAAAHGFVQPAGQLHDHPSTNVAELQQLLGVASILVTTVLFVVPIQLVLRRWRPPAGSFTVLLGFVTFLFVALDEFQHAPIVVAGVVAGIAADAVAARRAPVGVVAGVATAVLWLAYFALFRLAAGEVGWTAELWLGTTVLASLLAVGISLPSEPGLVGPRREAREVQT